jgi:hypothetical protein
MWWFKKPYLILIDKITYISTLDHNRVVEIENKKNHIYNILEKKFRRFGCEVIYWKEDLNLQPINTNYAVIINPVYLSLNEKVEKVLKNNIEDISLLRDELPEVEPLAVKIGKKICEKLKIYPELHPNFINMIFMEDNIDIHLIKSSTKVLFIRFLMAKLGAFKNIIVPLKEDKIKDNKVILGTLEGGHPSLYLNELAKRLMVFGSCKEVGGWKEIENIEIPKEVWQKSTVLNSMIELGKFLGEKGLLSSPVEIKNLLKDEKLYKFITRLVNYSRQAEGAFMAYEPNIYNGVFAVTCSGKYGTIKSNLTPKDISFVLPIENGKVGVLKKEGEEVLGPSVEAEEFIIPIWESKERIKINGVNVPPIRGIVHLHRGYEIHSSEDDFIEIPVNIEEYPPVGCGVDLMQEMSRYAINKAIEIWKEKGKKSCLAFFNVPNHGTNIFIFWKDMNGYIPENPFYFLIKYISENRINFTEVPQF